jgi:hypothetical protein
MSNRYSVSFSGGKDSTAMLLRLLEERMKSPGTQSPVAGWSRPGGWGLCAKVRRDEL